MALRKLASEAPTGLGVRWAVAPVASSSSTKTAIASVFSRGFATGMYLYCIWMGDLESVVDVND